MRGFAGVVFCALLAAGSADAAECQLKQFGSLDIAGVPDRILLPVSFGDTPKQFELALASSFNYVSPDTVTELGLKTRPWTSRVPTAAIHTTEHTASPHTDEHTVTQLAYAPKFQFGAIKGEDVEFLVLPQAEAVAGVDGIIGTRVFAKFDFELDVAHAKMNLFLTDHCPGKVVYWTKTGFAQLPFKTDQMYHVTTNMVLDGQPVGVSLQTGGRSEIGMNAMRRLFKLDETAPGMTLAETRPDGQKIYQYPFKTLTADGLTVANPKILVLDEPVREECDGKSRLKELEAP